MTVLKKVIDMKAGQLYIMQYNDSYFKVGRTVDVKKRLQSYPTGTQLHFTCLTSDMRRAEASMLASLRSLEAVSEGIEAQPNCGKETFRGPFAKIARRVTAAAQEFPAEPHNMMSVEAARAWYDGRDGDTGTSFTQFLIDNECVTLINNQSTRPRPIARRLYRIKRACPAMDVSLGRLSNILQHGPIAFESSYHTKLSEPGPQEPVHNFYQPAIMVNNLLRRLDAEWLKKIICGIDKLEITTEELKEGLTDWLTYDMTEGEYIDLMYKLGIVRRSDSSYNTRAKLINALSRMVVLDNSGKADKTTRVACGQVARLLNATFGIKFLPAHNNRRSSRILDFSLYTSHFSQPSEH